MPPQCPFISFKWHLIVYYPLHKTQSEYLTLFDKSDCLAGTTNKNVTKFDHSQIAIDIKLYILAVKSSCCIAKASFCIVVNSVLIDMHFEFDGSVHRPTNSSVNTNRRTLRKWNQQITAIVSLKALFCTLAHSQPGLLP